MEPMEPQEPNYQEQIDALTQYVFELESRIEFLMNFGELDLELTFTLLGFWLTSFVLAHVAGRVARTMGKF